MMFLSIDAGNSNIVFGIFDRSSTSWIHELRVETNKNLLPLQLVTRVKLFFLEENLKPESITRIGLSSVVPELNKVLVEFCEIFFGITPYTIQGKQLSIFKSQHLTPQ